MRKQILSLALGLTAVGYSVAPAFAAPKNSTPVNGSIDHARATAVAKGQYEQTQFRLKEADVVIDPRMMREGAQFTISIPVKNTAEFTNVDLYSNVKVTGTNSDIAQWITVTKPAVVTAVGPKQEAVLDFVVKIGNLPGRADNAEAVITMQVDGIKSNVQGIGISTLGAVNNYSAPVITPPTAVE